MDQVPGGGDWWARVLGIRSSEDTTERQDLGYHRIHCNTGHRQSSIINANLKNAFAKYTAVPERKGDVSTFKFNVKSTHKTCVERQITEGVLIHNTS